MKVPDALLGIGPLPNVRPVMNEKKFRTDSQTCNTFASLNCCGESGWVVGEGMFLLSLERPK